MVCGQVMSRGRITGAGEHANLLEAAQGAARAVASPLSGRLIDRFGHSLPLAIGLVALQRFLRPVAYQGLPDAALPAPLRQNNPWRIPRRLDGEIES